MGEPRAAISPSHLTYAWGDCHRCLWLQYNHSVAAPIQMPLIGDLADMQERYFIGAKTSDMHPDLPEGRVHSHGGWVASKNIVVDGVDSGLFIRGKYDLLLEFADGTFGIIDCKLQKKDYDKSTFYAPQLEAYAFSLENPLHFKNVCRIWFAWFRANALHQKMVAQSVIMYLPVEKY